MGAGIRHNENDVDQRYPGGRVEVFWDSAVTRARCRASAASRGTYGYYTVDDLGTFGEAAANIAHFYVQDQWSVGRLTLNLGLRLEDEKIPAFRERGRRDRSSDGARRSRPGLEPRTTCLATAA